MFSFYLTGCRWALLVLFTGGLGACQRAAFQFQRTAAAPYLATMPVPKPAELLVLPRLRAAGLPAGARPPRAHHSRQLAVAARASGVVALPAGRRTAAVTTSVAAVPPPQQPPPTEPTRHRSRSIALALAFLSITYVPFSLHNFYLGYHGRGAIAIAMSWVGLFLFVLGGPGFLFGGSITVVGYAGIVVLAAWSFWQISDFIRIITGSLQPKNSSYGKKGT